MTSFGSEQQVQVQVYMCVCVYGRVCMCVYVYTYIHTYMQCMKCMRWLRSAGGLAVHRCPVSTDAPTVSIRHESDSFRCDVCRRSFRSRSGLTRHHCDRAKRMSRAARNNCRHECETVLKATGLATPCRILLTLRFLSLLFSLLVVVSRFWERRGPIG